MALRSVDCGMHRNDGLRDKRSGEISEMRFNTNTLVFRNYRRFRERLLSPFKGPLLLRHPTPIHDDLSARNVAGLIGGQVQNGVSDVVRLAEPAERYA